MVGIFLGIGIIFAIWDACSSYLDFEGNEEMVIYFDTNGSVGTTSVGVRVCADDTPIMKPH